MKQSLSYLVLGVLALLCSAAVRAQNGHPLNLEEAVKIALERNSQVINAGRQVKVAETSVTSARSAILPQINTSFSSRRSRQIFEEPRIDLQTGRVLGTGVYFNTHQMSVSYQQNLFDFGASWNTIRQASALKSSAEHTFQSTRQGTILLVYQRYYQLLKDIRLLEVSQQAVHESEEQFKRTQSMYEIGSVAQVEVYLAKSQYGNSRIDLIQQENLVRNSRADLNVALGFAPDAPLEISDLEDSTAKAYAMEQVMQTAVQNNPSLQRYKTDMKAASLGVSAAKAQYLPSIGVFMSYGRNSTEFDQVYSNYDRNFSANVGLNMSLNLFNGFSDMARIEREATSYRIAHESLIEQERLLRQQVQQALLGLEAWREVSAINNDNLQAAEENLRLEQERYRVGAGTLLNIITAQVNLTRARSTLVQAKYDTKIAEAQLEAAMGTLR